MTSKNEGTNVLQEIKRLVGTEDLRELFLEYSTDVEESDLPTTKKLGKAVTVGELRKLISQYSDDTEFGFRNQPMQELYEVDYDGVVYVVFQ